MNEAVAGARAVDLKVQADRLLSAKPDYVTIQIGANDLCAWPSEHTAALEAFASDTRKAITKVVTSRPEVRILLTAIPDMNWLQELGSRHGCDSKWRMFGICQNLLGQRTTAQREAFRGRWQDANTALAAVASEFPQHVKFAEAVATTRFEWADISSLDCFHPSIAGQRKLADLSYQDGWFE